MRQLCVFLLATCAICAVGCGYSSHNGMMASSGPAMSQLMPNQAVAGRPAFTLTVNGSNFVNGTVVYRDGAARTTRFVTSTQITAAITASDVANAATVSVYARNPAGTGMYSSQSGQNSNTMDFMVSP